MKECSEHVRAVGQEKNRRARVHLTVLDHGIEKERGTVDLLIDSGVHKTLVSEKDWDRLQDRNTVKERSQLKVNRRKFRPYGTECTLPILGRIKCYMRAVGGKVVKAMIYIVQGETESLLGLKDAEALGILQIRPEGKEPEEQVGQLYEVHKEGPRQGIVSGGQTQEEIDGVVQGILGQHQEVFKGIGVAKVDPVHIEINKKIKPVQQKRRPIAIHYLEKFKEHIEELRNAGVISGPLKSESATGWIHNVVISQKSWTDKKIRVNLDTRPMKDAIITSHLPIHTTGAKAQFCKLGQILGHRSEPCVPSV